MLEHFSLKLISPNRVVLDLEIKQVNIPAKMGYMGVGARHAGLTCELKTGLVGVENSKENGGTPLQFFISGGHFQIRSNKAILLAETVETKEEIDEKRVLESEKRACARLKERANNAKLDLTRALQSLERARARKQLLKS